MCAVVCLTYCMCVGHTISVLCALMLAYIAVNGCGSDGKINSFHIFCFIFSFFLLRSKS
jgi:hypothetical protein